MVAKRCGRAERLQKSSLTAGFHVGACCFGLILMAGAAWTSPPAKKLSVENLMNLLSGGVATPRIVQLVNERGIDFQVNRSLEQTVLDSGGDPNLIEALRQQAAGGARPLASNVDVTSPPVVRPGPRPATTSPPSPAPNNSPGGLAVARLQVRSQPGGVAIFLDGESRGTTDEDGGQLEVGVSKPGKHVLRASREGYQDVEATLDIARDQTLDVPIWLSQTEPTAPKVAAAPELPPGKKFLVRHIHRAISGVAAAGYCQGWMIVNVGYVRYLSTDTPHKYLMNTSELKHAKPSSGEGNFSLKLDFGREYQFEAVNEQGKAVNSGPVLAEIRYSMGQ
ncbi:MAG: PEGA domain-containing protein [Acidobacteria bacterium]|nr:PEGA domain-containing protein [Acidobacteriota bacterium]